MAKIYSKDRYGRELTLDQMIKKWKKNLEKDQVLIEVKRHEYFINKRIKLQEKSKRHQKLIRKLDQKQNKN